MGKNERRKLDEAYNYLNGLSKEEFTEVFPDWIAQQEAHMLAGLDVYQSWQLFVEAYAARENP